MSEQRPANKPVPVRIRLRTPFEHVELQSALASQVTDAAIPAQIDVPEVQRRTQQIKELIRLGNLLQADSSLEEVLRHIVNSVRASTGFRILVVNLLEQGNSFAQPVAFAGLSEEGQRFIRDHPMSVEQMHRVMHPQFRISQSYFIPYEHADARADIPAFVESGMSTPDSGGWHPEDMLLVPLTSSRQQRLSGCLSLNAPEDGKRPTKESIEVVELFASQVAIAIDKARFFEEREAERAELENGISQLGEDLERLQKGDLRIRVHPSHQKLRPIGDAINAMVEEMSELLGSVKMVTQAVDEHTRNVQRNSDVLVRDTSQQERQVHQISDVINEIAGMMQQISERSDVLLKTAMEAMEVTLEGQGAVDRAVEGMGRVREATMHSTRTMKHLGESGQEINETVIYAGDVTGRLHLLALNAAIEAARAGEHGQGFAVIAQEIRTLATHCAEASRKIGSYIRTIQHDTSAVARSVEQSTQQVVMQTELVTQTGIALDAISVVTEQMTHLVQGICATTESQARGSQLVVSAIAEILRMTQEITQHTYQVQQSLAHLVQLTDSLRSRVSAFLTS